MKKETSFMTKEPSEIIFQPSFAKKEPSEKVSLPSFVKKEPKEKVSLPSFMEKEPKEITKEPPESGSPSSLSTNHSPLRSTRLPLEQSSTQKSRAMGKRPSVKN
jgi:hypothetical protein